MDPQPSTEPVALRPAEAGDLAFIYSTWLRDLRHADGGPLADDIWFPAHREHVNRVLMDSKVQVMVIHPTDARTQILGYVVAEPDAILHWVYIKPRYREKFGLCRRLLEAVRATEALASWTTQDARTKLRNPRRPRMLRQRYASPRAASA